MKKKTILSIILNIIVFCVLYFVLYKLYYNWYDTNFTALDPIPRAFHMSVNMLGIIYLILPIICIVICIIVYCKKNNNDKNTASLKTIEKVIGKMCCYLVVGFVCFIVSYFTDYILNTELTCTSCGRTYISSISEGDVAQIRRSGRCELCQDNYEWGKKQLDK